jgi:hypothetical protein
MPIESPPETFASASLIGLRNYLESVTGFAWDGAEPEYDTFRGTISFFQDDENISNSNRWNTLQSIYFSLKYYGDKTVENEALILRWQGHLMSLIDQVRFKGVPGTFNGNPTMVCQGIRPSVSSGRTVRFTVEPDNSQNAAPVVSAEIQFVYELPCPANDNPIEGFSSF